MNKPLYIKCKYQELLYIIYGHFGTHSNCNFHHKECKTLHQQITGLTSIYLKLHAYTLTLHIVLTGSITVTQFQLIQCVIFLTVKCSLTHGLCANKHYYAAAFVHPQQS